MSQSSAAVKKNKSKSNAQSCKTNSKGGDSASAASSDNDASNHGFPTSESLYNRLRTDSSFVDSRGVLVYKDMGDRYMQVSVEKFRPIKRGGDIPWHRIWQILYDGKVIWDRATKVCTVDKLLQTHKQKKCLPAPFSVVTINVLDETLAVNAARKSTVTTPAPSSSSYSANSSEERKNALLEYLQQCHADVVCLQEVSSSLATLLQSHSAFSEYTIASTSLDSMNVLILSRATILQSGTIALSEGKQAVYADVDMCPADSNSESDESNAAVPLRLIGVHLTSDYHGNKAGKRQLQLQMLHSFALDYSKSFILLGDFNDPAAQLSSIRANDIWKVLKQTKKNIASASSVSVLSTSESVENEREDDEDDEDNEKKEAKHETSAVDDEHSGYTFDPRSNELAAVTSRSGLPYRYDRILFHGLLQPLSTHVDSSVRISDHFPLHASFSCNFTPTSSAVLKEDDVEGNAFGALSLMLPCRSELCETINDIRSRHDPAFKKWPSPHISLIHPFTKSIARYNAAISALVLQHLPMSLTFHGAAFFAHLTSFTVYESLDSESEKLVQTLQMQLAKTTESSAKMNFRPHVTVAKCKSQEDAEALCRRLSTLQAVLQFDKLQYCTKNEQGVYCADTIFTPQIPAVPSSLSPSTSSSSSSSSTAVTVSSSFSAQRQNLAEYELLVSLLEDGGKRRVILGGSSVFHSRNNSTNNIYSSDYDMLVLGQQPRADFFSSMTTLLRTSGEWDDVRLITSDAHSTEYIRIKSAQLRGAHFDVHYFQANSSFTMSTLASALLSTSTPTSQISSLAGTALSSFDMNALQVVCASRAVVEVFGGDELELKTFADNLLQVKNALRCWRVYGQNYGYLPGLAVAVMVARLMMQENLERKTATELPSSASKDDEKNSSSTGFLQRFCKFYSTWEISHPIAIHKPISLAQSSSSSATGATSTVSPSPAAPSERFLRVLSPVAPHHNMVRTMTSSSMQRLLFCWSLDKEQSEPKRTLLTARTVTKKEMEEFLVFIQSCWLKICLQLEKLTGHKCKHDDEWQVEQLKLVGDDATQQTEQYAYSYEGRFTLGEEMNSCKTVWSGLISKVSKLFPRLQLTVTLIAR